MGASHPACGCAWSDKDEKQLSSQSSYPGLSSAVTFDDGSQPWTGRVSLLSTLVPELDDGGEPETMVPRPDDRVVSIDPAQRHAGEVSALAFSGDGFRLASGGLDSTIKLWEVPSGKLCCTMAGHRDRVTSLCLTSDHSVVVSGSWDGSLMVWRSAEGRRVAKINEQSYGEVNSVALGKDGSTLAAAGGTSCKIWRTNDPEA